MSSYVLIDLDTTKPEISIYAPRYTTEEITNVITIEANEALSTYQEIYIIDSAGQRHDYTFEKESDNNFVGRIRFNNLPLGIAIIHARVTDEVDNVSDLALSAIEIKKAITLLSLEINEFNRVIHSTNPNPITEMELTDISISSLVKSTVTSKDIDVSITTNNIDIRSYDSKEEDEVYG